MSVKQILIKDASIFTFCDNMSVVVLKLSPKKLQTVEENIIDKLKHKISLAFLVPCPAIVFKQKRDTEWDSTPVH